MGTKLVRPVIEPHVVTSPYGYRILNGKTELHEGIDYVSGADNRVVAIGDSKVNTDMDDYDHAKRWKDRRHSVGNYVILDVVINGVLYHFRYCHLIENYVSPGQEVKMGEVIGIYGDVGYSFGAHLHIDCYNADWTGKLDPTPIILAGLKESGII
jgi:murein DD-endopeptidase MepM/ murein hydrolase activator NlpD